MQISILCSALNFFFLDHQINTNMTNLCVEFINNYYLIFFIRSFAVWIVWIEENNSDDDDECNSILDGTLCSLCEWARGIIELAAMKGGSVNEHISRKVIATCNKEFTFCENDPLLIW